MSDQTSDPSGDILRDLSEKHEDQPGDLGQTTPPSEPAPKSPD